MVSDSKRTSNMITSLYRKYFQKSNTFLYPLLGFKKNQPFSPAQTYITWNDLFFPDNKVFIVIYNHDESSDAWKKYQHSVLMTHDVFKIVIDTPDNKHKIYIFSFENFHKEDYDAFVRGQYSKFSGEARKKITDFYGKHTPEWAYVESFIFPERYFANYAEILDVNEDLLREIGELCEKPDELKENLNGELNTEFVEHIRKICKFYQT
jgi:hypothetical protein